MFKNNSSNGGTGFNWASFTFWFGFAITWYAWYILLHFSLALVHSNAAALYPEFFFFFFGYIGSSNREPPHKRLRTSGRSLLEQGSSGVRQPPAWPSSPIQDRSVHLHNKGALTIACLKLPHLGQHTHHCLSCGKSFLARIVLISHLQTHRCSPYDWLCSWLSSTMTDEQHNTHWPYPHRWVISTTGYMPPLPQSVIAKTSAFSWQQDFLAVSITPQMYDISSVYQSQFYVSHMSQQQDISNYKLLFLKLFWATPSPCIALPGPVSLTLGICATQPSHVTSAYSYEISIFTWSNTPPPHLNIKSAVHVSLELSYISHVPDYITSFMTSTFFIAVNTSAHVWNEQWLLISVIISLTCCITSAVSWHLQFLLLSITPLIPSIKSAISLCLRYHISLTCWITSVVLWH